MTGAVYTDDVVDERLAGAGHVFFVRSPIAHARIANVDTSAALAPTRAEDIHADRACRQHLARVLTRRALEHQTG